MEFPKNPTERQLRKQQAVSTVIAGIAAPRQLEIDFVPEPQLPSAELGFNWETYTSYVKWV